MRPVLPRALHATACAALTATALAALPAAAQAADAPLRTIGIDVGGALTLSQYPIAITLDGRQVLSGKRYGNGQPVLRDVAAGTTTTLFTDDEKALGASLDLGRILIETDRQLSPQDTDDEADYYVHDRAAGTTKLISGDIVTGAPGTPADDVWLQNASISGDGKVVFFRSGWQNYGPQPGTTNVYGYDAWRYDVPSGALSRVSTWGQPINDGYTLHAIDNAGAVSVTPNGLQVGSKTWPLPVDPATNATSFNAWVSPDGSTVVYRYVNPPVAGTLTFQSTATGVVSNVKVPSWLLQEGYTVNGAGNAGSGAVLSTGLNRGDGPRAVLGFLTKTGALSQIGGDVRVSESTGVSAVSQNLQFAASPQHLAQLGTTALPGTEPNVPTPPELSPLEYVSVSDTFCSVVPFFFIKSWSKAFVSVREGPVGTDPRRVTGSEWRVFNTTTNQTINAFTLAPNKSKDLTVPRTGGWTTTVKLKFSNGTTATGSKVIAPHAPYSC